MKHKHAEMIKAKADNMDLVLLVKVNGGWKKSQNELPGGHGYLDYFLCHPKHVSQTIHWLNGGETQLYSGDHFYNMPMYDGGKWHIDLVFMDECRESRIKPKKEKRWIVVSKSQVSGVSMDYNYCSVAYKFKSDAVSAKSSFDDESNYQIIEIEIEAE